MGLINRVSELGSTNRSSGERELDGSFNNILSMAQLDQWVKNGKPKFNNSSDVWL